MRTAKPPIKKNKRCTIFKQRHRCTTRRHRQANNSYGHRGTWSTNKTTTKNSTYEIIFTGLTTCLEKTTKVQINISQKELQLILQEICPNSTDYQKFINKCSSWQDSWPNSYNHSAREWVPTSRTLVHFKFWYRGALYQQARRNYQQSTRHRFIRSCK